MLVLVMRLGIGVRRWEIECRVYIAGGGRAGQGQGQNKVFVASACRTKQRVGVGVGIESSRSRRARGFSPRILSSRLFLPLFVLYYLIFYIKEKKTGRFKLLCEFVK